MKQTRICEPRRILFLILTVSFFLRFYQLGQPSLWYDEALTAAKTGISFNQIIPELRSSGEENPPGYFYVTHWWARAFGNSEFSLRFPSLIFSLFAILSVYYLGSDLFSARVGLLGAFLLAISPLTINYAQEARMYSLFWFLGIFSLLFFNRFLRSGKTTALFFCAAGILCSFFVSYSGLLYLLTLNILFFCNFRKKLFKRWLTVQGITILVCLGGFFLLTPESFSPINTAGNWRPPVNDYGILLFRLSGYVSGILRGDFTVWEIVPFFLVIILGWFSISERRIRCDLTRGDFIIWGWSLIPLLIALFYNILFQPFLTHLTFRYIGFIHLTIIIAVARGIDRLRPAGTILVTGALTAFIAVNFLIPYYRDDGRIGSENWRDLIGRLDRSVTAQDLVVLPPGVIYVYNYYHRYPDVDTTSAAEMKKADFDPNYRRVFVIYRRWRQRIKFKDLPGYTLIGHFPFDGVGYYIFKKDQP